MNYKTTFYLANGDRGIHILEVSGTADFDNVMDDLSREDKIFSWDEGNGKKVYIPIRNIMRVEVEEVDDET